MHNRIQHPRQRARTFPVLLVCIAAFAGTTACADRPTPPTAPVAGRPVRSQAAMLAASVTVLPTLGGTSTAAADINDAGQVVGSSSTASGLIHAFLWSEAEGMQDLGTLGGPTSRATAINDAGQVVGMSASLAGKSDVHAFLWTRGEGMQDLGALRAPLSTALGINDRGQVVGNNIIPGVLNRAFVWTREDGMRDLAPAWSSALAINNAGQAVGNRTTGNSVLGAVLWTADGSAQDLGTLGGVPTTAAAINESGEVVGYASPPDQRPRAFLWTSGPGMRDLGTLGGPSSEAYAINDGGQVVGYSTVAADGAHHAFVWTPLDGMRDLLASTGMSDAFAINNHGQVVGGNRVATLQSQLDPGAFITGSGFVTDAGRPKAKAHFTFNVRFLGDGVAPNGKVIVWVPGGSLDFESTAIEMLVVSGRRTEFWGSGSLVGSPARFRITAVEGNPGGRGGSAGAVRIVLWRSAAVVFDTQPGAAPDAPVTTEVQGGNIRIHPD